VERRAGRSTVGGTLGSEETIVQGNRTQTARRPVAPASTPVRRKRRGFFFLKLLLFILICLVAAMSFSRVGYNYITEGAAQATAIPQDSGGSEFTIPYGSSTDQIAVLLKDAGYKVDPTRFRLISKFVGFDGLYKAGRYIISKDMNEYALMLRLTGDPLQNPSVDIRIPEGLTVVELADYLSEQEGVIKEKFLRLCRMHLTQFPFQEELTVTDERTYPLEGYLYPDTYRLDAGWDEETLVLRLLDEFNRVYTDKDRERAAELGMTTDEVVALASLIEMEALYPEDLKKISSVFHNRLNSTDMTLLQSDTTIQYARVMAGEGRTTTVLYQDLEIESPYNTYLHPGLPPGPICSPRREAIEAALYPEETEYLFFFATPDGTNIYNETYQGHLNDQAKYGVSGQ
jgi:UPF0755 protein